MAGITYRYSMSAVVLHGFPRVWHTVVQAYSLPIGVPFWGIVPCSVQSLRGRWEGHPQERHPIGGEVLWNTI